ncbi:MAG: molybdopterin molybdotransferase MoeA [Acidobacteria bacterium]|nr:MAG: molybdopterin molybdotransferase MoeA [Acidobacteriota bacterium]
MRSLKAVRAEVLKSMRRLGTETIPFDEGVGRVLAEAIVSSEDVPHFANSAMDGFAVRATDVSEPDAVLEVLADLPAGEVASVSMSDGQAIRIMTGAPMPDGADTVVRVEDTTAEGDKVRIHTVVEEGTYVREAGGDVRAGQVVFDPGLRMGPIHVGVLATLGLVEPVVSRRPRVGVMSTGNELQPPATQDLAPGMIRDSNRPMLVGLLEDAGAEVIDYGRIGDDADELRAALGRAAVETDAIVTTGGVSMGDYDVTKLVLREEAGVDFIKVAMKPGKPLAFGRLGGAPFFGLPGNPVSVVVSFEQFVRPALLTMQGASAVLRPQMTVAAGERLVTDPAKTVFLRVRLEGDGAALRATQAGGQASNILSVAAVADAFAVVPIGVETIDEGEPVLIELFRSPETREHRHDV